MEEEDNNFFCVDLSAIRVVSWQDPPQVYCSHCGEFFGMENEYFNCLDCDNYDLCVDCAGNGVICQDGDHRWILSRMNEYGGIERTKKIRAKSVRDAQNYYPTPFEPPSPSDSSRSLFEEKSTSMFINRNDPQQILIYTAGECSDNACAGWSFVYRQSLCQQQPGKLNRSGTIAGRLEKKGPTGVEYSSASNRAELRAVIAALQFRDWSIDCGERWTSIVIATCSEYVALGATNGIQKLDCEGWRISNSDRTINSNKDLWELLIKVTRRLQSLGVSVQVWRIPREWNERADKSAKFAVERSECFENFMIVKPYGPDEVRCVPFYSAAPRA